MMCGVKLTVLSTLGEQIASRNAVIDARQHRTGSHACSSAKNVVQNVCVYLQGHMETSKNVHATITGKLSKEVPNALKRPKNIRPFLFSYLHF